MTNDKIDRQCEISASPSADANAPENTRKHPICADDSPQPSPLSDQQLAAIRLLLQGVKLGRIAKEIHVDPRTLYTWRTHNPHFRAELQARRDQLLFETSDRFRNLLDSSLDTLELQVRDRYAPTAHRAARTLLTLARIGNYIAPQPATSNQQPPTSNEQLSTSN